MKRILVLLVAAVLPVLAAAQNAVDGKYLQKGAVPVKDGKVVATGANPRKLGLDNEMIKIINGWDKKPSILLHSCCAPCSSYVLEYLSQYFDVSVDYLIGLTDKRTPSRFK